MDKAKIKQCEEILEKRNLYPIKKLGQGGFGIVYLVSETNAEQSLSEYYSVKCISKEQFTKRPVLMHYLKQQIQLLENLSHENIVQLHRTFEDNGWIFLMMEYCTLGNIAHIQKGKSEMVYSFQEASEIIADVIKGLQYMHARDVIHRDIKPQNILRTKENKKIKTKLCDLGFSREAKEDVDTFCGTTYFMAPELFMRMKYNNEVDVWALGVVFFFMLFGDFPFKSMNMLNQITKKCQKGFFLANKKKRNNPSINEDQMKILEELFKGIFEINPIKRFTLYDILVILEKQQTIIETKLSIKNFSQNKITIESENTDGSSQNSQQSVSFLTEKVNFISTVLIQVKELKFLNLFETKTLEYYLDKICLELLKSENSYYEQKNRIIAHLEHRLKSNYKFLLEHLQQCTIPNFINNFNPKIFKSFPEYKEQYRIAVGHVFHKAHKEIQNFQLKIKTKLKLFCCHIINRVFQNQYRQQIFPNFFSWLQKTYFEHIFDIGRFQEWISTEKPKRLIETIETLNNKFYKKAGK